MPELPSEPSVSTVKKQLEQPVTDEQAKLLQEHLENPLKTTQAEFLSNLESYPSVFPDAVTTYFMKKQGLETTDPRVVRMISLATQKFVSDVILDSMMQAKIKGHTSKPGKPVVLTEELLAPQITRTLHRIRADAQVFDVNHEGAAVYLNARLAAAARVLSIAGQHTQDEPKKKAEAMIGAIELACAYRRWRGGPENGARDTKKIVEKDIKRVTGGARLADEQSISLETIMAEFKLSNNTLRRMMCHMSDNMDRGLDSGLSRSTIAMLPSFVPELPDGTERGKFVAMDLGGTNLRVMLTEIEPGEPMRMKQFNTRISNAAMHGTAELLFDYIAKALADFLIERGVADDNLPVGFTFSYPCDQTGLRSATLMRWTKGVTAKGAVGKDVVQLLEDAIRRDGRVTVEIVALINDTVGTLVAASYESNGQCDIGVIIGTGTNASYLEQTKNIIYGLSKATEEYHHDMMIIDTEWGGFGDRGEAEYIFTQYDKMIDERSDHPGVNSLDKLIAGMCMGELVRLVLEKLCTHKILFNGNGSKALYKINNFPTKYISEILHDDCGSYATTRQIMDELGIESYTFSDMLLLREVCIVVSRRSANLAAASIACVLNRVKRPRMVVSIDGSTYKYHPFYEHWVKEKLKELINPGLEFQLVQSGDGSGKGAALIAAIVTRIRKTEERKKRDEAARLKREEEEREANIRKQLEEIEIEKKAEEEWQRKRAEEFNYAGERIEEEQRAH